MEELIRSLYSKYAAGLSEDEMNEKVQYALQQDPNEFIDAFYQKYTGAGPSSDQVDYMNSYLSNKPEEASLVDENAEKSWFQKVFGKQATTAEAEGEFFDFLIDPDSFSAKDKADLVKLKDAYSKLGPSDDMVKYQKNYETNLKKYGDDPNTFQEMWAGLKALGSTVSLTNPVGALDDIAVDSLLRPVRVMYGSEEAWKVILGAGGLSSARGKGKNPTTKALYGLQGAWAVAQGSGDASLQLHQLLVEELGQDYTAEDLEGLMSDDEKFNEIRRAAALKGGTTALVDYAFMSASVATGKTINKTLANANVPGFIRKPLAVGGAMQVEGLGGATAEGAGQLASNLEMTDGDLKKSLKDIDGSELVLEYFAEQLFGGVTGGIGLSKSGTYKINGHDHTEKDFRQLMDGYTDEEIGQITSKVI